MTKEDPGLYIRTKISLQISSWEDLHRVNYMRKVARELRAFDANFDRLTEIDQIEKEFDDMTVLEEGREGEYLSQRRIALILCNSDYLQKGWEYFLGGLRVGEFSDQLNSTLRPLRNLDIDLLNNPEEKNNIRLMFDLADVITKNNPLYEGIYSRHFFWDLAEAAHPLDDDYKQVLSAVFRDTNESLDVAMMAFLQYNDTKRDRMVGKGKKADGAYGSDYDHLTKTIQLFFQDYRDRCMRARFGDLDSSSESIFPESSTLLPVAAAISFANHTDILPLAFNDLMTHDFFPGLSGEAAQVINTFYEAKFVQAHPGVLHRENAEKQMPYVLATESLQQGENKALWNQLITDYENEPEREADNLEVITWLSNPNLFRRVRNLLGDGFCTIDLGKLGLRANVGAYGERREDKQKISGIQPTIDIIITDSENRSIILQIHPGSNLGGVSDPGRIWGIPEEFEEIGKPIVADIFSQAKTYVESELYPSKPQQKLQISKPLQIPSDVPTLPKITRAQRMAEYEARQQEREKEKNLKNRRGEKSSENEVVVSALEQAAGSFTKLMEERNFSLSLIFSETFLESLKMLPEQMQRRIRKALELARHDHKMRKPIHQVEPHAPNVYSVRVGNVRIILVQSGKGEMVVTNVKKRGIVYNELSKDLDVVQEYLTRK